MRSARTPGPAVAPLRVGVLGCASIARRRMLPAMLATPEVTPVAVASRDPAKAAALARDFGLEPVTGYDALLARDDLDAVYVPLPVTLHATWVDRALRAGRHVLCEKPLTGEGGSSARLVRTARERGLVLMESMMFVRHSQHRVVREIVASGGIGSLRSLTAEFAFPPKPATDMRYTPAGGGALPEIGVYPLRTAQLYLGSDLRVRGAVLHRDAGLGVDLSGAALLSTPDGRPAHLTWGMEHAYRSAYELWGSEGRLVVEWAYTPPADHSPVIRIERQDGSERRVLEPHDQFRDVLECFCRAVRTGCEDGLQGGEIVALAELVDQVREAASAGGGGGARASRPPGGHA
ncbi:Gfo/Idh/MocA family protein [Streptomyces sp. NPDC059740]|uniref:Gfo/Idh/MocA family protein n=1 Tax=Streptomyces sp. NPDC059740 TaxID=3346926 RepID=UPI00365367B9